MQNDTWHDNALGIGGNEAPTTPGGNPSTVGQVKGTPFGIRRFLAAAKALPTPGSGCHPALLGVANLGVTAGLADEQIFDVIRASIPTGNRQVPDSEIWDAINKARGTNVPAGMLAPVFRPNTQSKKAKMDNPNGRAAIISRGGGAVDPDDPAFRASSPVGLTWPNGLDDTIALFATAYAPHELVFVGTRYENSLDNIRPAADWLAFFRQKQAELNALPADQRWRAEVELATIYPQFIPNLLSGGIGLTKAGKPSYRADSCVASFRWIVAEFDTIGKAEQIAFFRGLGMPCTALIDTGGKSIHAFLRVDMRDAVEWEREVEVRMFDILGPLGIDCSCKNESRLSRLPGVRRLKEDDNGILQDTGNFQRLLWLARGAAVL